MTTIINTFLKLIIALWSLLYLYSYLNSIINLLYVFKIPIITKIMDNISILAPKNIIAIVKNGINIRHIMVIIIQANIVKVIVVIIKYIKSVIIYIITSIYIFNCLGLLLLTTVI